MEFTKYDLGHRKRGEIVEVRLSGNAANVRLMSSSNFTSFVKGRKHHYHGGHVTKSPYQIAVPYDGHWYVTIDLGGYKGKVRSSVQVLSGNLPAAKQRTALSSVPSLVREPVNDTGDASVYDVFISHASEDKDEVARPLADALSSKGLRVWYDEYELKIGDSLRRKIDRGLACSRFGIVVISRDFIKKGWTNYELDGLVTRVVSGEQVLLPIWHNITKAEVVNFAPSLADKLARNTAVDTIEDIADEIADLICPA